MNASGKTAPSFIAAVAILVLGVVGYLAWDILRPSPVARSEMVVREFSAAAASELSGLRRALRDTVAQYKSDPAAARAAMADDAAVVRENIEDLANAARDDLGYIEGIGLRTQDNRLQRIKTREADALSRIDGLIADARSKLPPEPEP